MGDAVKKVNGIIVRLRVNASCPTVGGRLRGGRCSGVRRRTPGHGETGAERRESTDRRIGFPHLMLRRTAGLLGCTNDPLTEDPVAEPYATTSEAATTDE
jgi:hypothetical protein